MRQFLRALFVASSPEGHHGGEVSHLSTKALSSCKRDSTVADRALSRAGYASIDGRDGSLDTHNFQRGEL